MSNEYSDVVLDVADLSTVIDTPRGVLPIVDGVSFQVRRGETFGLIGESGSGKSMTALSVLRLNPRGTRIGGGRIIVNDRDVLAAGRRELQKIRGACVSIILQDPNTALNPVIRVGPQIRESVHAHRPGGRAEERGRVIEVLKLLRVPDPEVRMRAYPHELSGGLRQRVVSAIALASNPAVLIADEATTALDATIQAAFLRHLRTIQQTTGVGILFITHDFAAASTVCDRIGVMYAGVLVEVGTAARVLRAPRHPYTQALVQSVPDVFAPKTKLVSIPGSPPAVENRPTGCPFHTRCWLFDKLGKPEVCRGKRPVPRADDQSGLLCHFPDEAEKHRLTRTNVGEAA